MRLHLLLHCILMSAMILFFSSLPAVPAIRPTVPESPLASADPAIELEALFSKFSNPRDPGCAVLVIRNSKVLFEKGFGVRDLRSFHPIDSETNFRLASLTKQFTATAIMLLVHEGKLHYDDHLTDIFSDFPTYGRAVAIRHLLNHTSGLVDYEDVMQKQNPGVPDDRIPQIHDAEVLALMKQQTGTKFPPGSRWDYSNSGYVVLAMVVEKISGMSFGDFLRERIFKPLAMNNTIAYEKGKNEVRNRAYGHTQTAAGWRETDQSSTSATLGDGGIYTSLDDLEKWNRALDQHTLLSAQDTAPALRAPEWKNGPLLTLSGSIAPRYGFGWFLDPLEGHVRYSHYGETVGFRNAIQRFPNDRLTVIVLSNRAELDAPALGESIAKVFLRHP